MTLEPTAAEISATGAAEHWNRVTRRGQTNRTRWWQIPEIVGHVNERVCGSPISGVSAGFNTWLSDKAGGETFRRGISVGAGNGVKEIELLSRNIVETFDVFEIASARVEQGRSIAAERGLSERITFHERLLGTDEFTDSYDFVHWNNALHHMLDVDEWLGWSRRVLRAGGVLAMDDFVGPDRFQWSDRQLEVASSYRGMLPTGYLVSPTDPETLLSRTVVRPTIEAMLAADPTEAADSSRILPSLRRHFPSAEIRFTGGVMYNLALVDIMANFEPITDSWMFAHAMEIDDLMSDLGENHYAVVFARV